MTISDGVVGAATKIVDNGPDSKRWNLVIMGDGYMASPQLGQFAKDAQTLATTLVATPPFDRLQGAINVHRVNVSWTQQGADDPSSCGGSGNVAATYFDATFCNQGVKRLLLIDVFTAILTASTKVPSLSALVVVVDTPIYGGGSNGIAAYSVAPSAIEIALHELGHSAFGLADEYEYLQGCGTADPGHDQHAASEPA